MTPAEVTARWRERHPEDARESNRRHYANNRENRLAATKRWRLAHPEAYLLGKRRQHLKRFGLTVEAFDAMVIAQGGRCAICRQPETRQRQGVTTLSVDHCHTTGRVRGLLCNRCNRAIGLLGDDATLCAQASEYLR